MFQNNMDPIEAYSLHQLGKLDSNKIVALANEWLNNNVYTKSLGELYDKVNPTMHEVKLLFCEAIQELGVPALTKIEAANYLIKLTLTRIVEKKVLPEVGASFLYWDVHHEIENDIPDNEYIGDNLDLENLFCWLREIWDLRDGSIIFYYTDLPSHQAEEKFKEHLIEEAQNWLNKNT